MLRCILDNELNEHMHFGSRDDLQIYNILDANIVPINFHALQREIPMINLYNYSYTFEHMVKQFLGVENANISVSDAKKSLDRLYPHAVQHDRYPADTLVRMLMDPCGFRSINNYINNVWSLMAGNDGLTLNTTKYLSDQLWNKVLLNSLNSLDPPDTRDTETNYSHHLYNWKNNNNSSLTMSYGTPQGRVPNSNPLVSTQFAHDDMLNFHRQITYQIDNNPINSNKHTLRLKRIDIG